MFERKKDPSSLNFQMNFDELFAETRDPNFIGKTKEYYLTEEIEVSAKDVLKLQYRLELNCWYQYFKNHVEEIKTWIDFEQKIEDVLLALARCIADLDLFDIRRINSYLNESNNQSKCIRKADLAILNFFEFTIYKQDFFPYSFNKKFCHGGSIENGFSSTIFSEYLSKQLDELIEIFNLYLEIVIGRLSQSSTVEIYAEEWSYPDKIFSFNYTNTYQRLHDTVEVEYLHGSCGENQNIVLGVSALEHESLKKIKAYGFTKYHQKLFKDTDYLFLDKFKKIIENGKKKFDEDLRLMNANALNEISARFIKRGLGSNATSLDLNFMIWGHSLDASDKDYIIDLFYLNDDIDRNVRVTVYYFDKPAKFALLNNLLAILGKDKVEQWMKNKWLVFKKNPEGLCCTNLAYKVYSVL